MDKKDSTGLWGLSNSRKTVFMCGIITWTLGSKKDWKEKIPINFGVCPSLEKNSAHVWYDHLDTW